MIYRNNSTIAIKRKPCRSCGRDSIIFSKGRCQNCAKIEDTQTKISASIMEEAGLPELIEKLDELVSKWVRYSNLNEHDLCECYTCEKWDIPSCMDAGHYITRACMYLRFDLRNIKPQCTPCNRGRYGMAPEFGKHLELDNPGITEILLDENQIIHKWSRSELESMIEEYKIKLKRLK